MKNGVKTIQSIQRAFDIIECFDFFNMQVGLKEISSRLDLNINTTRGIVKTLVANDYLNYDSISNRYSLGFVFIPKADLIRDNAVQNINLVISPFLNSLAEKYAVNCRCQIISRHNIFSVCSFTSEKANYAINPSINVLFPFHASASGKMLLAYLNDEEREELMEGYEFKPFTDNTVRDKNALYKELEDIRVKGYSIEIDEYGDGISCIAAPLFKSGKLFGTISVMAVTSVINEIREEVLVDMLDITQKVSQIIK